MNTEAIREALGLSLLEYREEVTSTQDIARSITAVPPYVVWAKEQTSGRGRMGRPWLSDAGGLYFTLVVNRMAESWAAPLVCAYCIKTQLSLIVPDLSLKWPNDVLYGQAKLAGVLAEAWQDRLGIGVGVNVNQVWFNEVFLLPATSLFMLTGKVFQMDELLRETASGILAALKELEVKGFKHFYPDIRETLLSSRQPVRFKQDEAMVTAQLLDLSPEGNGLVETSAGERFELSLSHLVGIS